MTNKEQKKTDQRRDDALRRALNTPPKPKDSGKGDKSQGTKKKSGD